MKRTAVAAAVAAAIGSLVAAPGAVAESNSAAPAYSFEWNEAVQGTHVWDGDTCAVTTGAYVCFQPYGDKIWVQDTKADGYSAVARWYTDYGRWGTCRNANGSGTWAVCNKDFVENSHLYFRASRYDGDTDVYISPESDLLGVMT